MNSAENILTLLKKLIALPSTTNTAKEILLEDFLVDYLKKFPYWQKHPSHLGKLPLPNDALGRKVIYALVKGPSPSTVLLLNHHDVVETENYHDLEPYAYDAEKITQLLATGNDAAADDFASGSWLGGRGSCDMKGGIAAQLDFLTEYAENPQAGSLLFLSVADEESFSAGMRAALELLPRLAKEQQLNYVLALNSEPNSRQNGTQIVPQGTVGKVLATVVIQGRSVHLGSYSQGLNPLALLTRLVAATEGNPLYQETYQKEHTVPPVWLQVRDQKENYDVSLPLRASGYCSFQTFSQGPEDILDLLKKEAANACAAWHKLQPTAPLPSVYTYQEFLQLISPLDSFKEKQEDIRHGLESKIMGHSLTYPEATIAYLNALLDLLPTAEPVILLALAPPYYPPVLSSLMGKDYFSQVLTAVVNEQKVAYENYFLGVSDCSYLGHTLPTKAAAFSANAPLWGASYNFNEALLKNLQIPFLLLGPWGKDLHQKTERVQIESLTLELPKALRKAAYAAWNK